MPSTQQILSMILASLSLLLLHAQGKRRLILLKRWKILRQMQKDGLGYRVVLPIPYERKITWSIASMGWTDIDCREYLRFDRNEIFRIITAINVPNGRGWRFGYHATSEEALCLFLFRLSYPHRLKDCMKIFGKSRTWCSTIFNDMAIWIYTQQKDRLRWDSARLTLGQLQAYSQAIENVCGVSGIWGFIDGTHRGISRPGVNQEEYYAGAKKEHGIRYQGIVSPDGIILLCGPWVGPTGDWRMWQESEIERELRRLFEETDEQERIYLYGDPAYYPGFGIMGPFRPSGRHMVLSPDEEAANIVMSGQRITVEWAFGLISKYWSFTAFKRANRIGLSPVGTYYVCAAFFTNVHSCLRGHNQISEKFNISTPSLEEYLGIK